MSLKFAVMVAAELTKLIGSIGKRKVALDVAVQKAAVQCIAQSIVHRNATPAMELFAALAGSMRRDALVVYLERFGNIRWVKDEKKLSFFENPAVKKLENEAAVDAWLDTAAETVWYSLKKENPVKSVYDADEAISSTIDRLHKMAKRGTKIENIEVLQAVERAYAQYHADKLQAEVDPELKQALEDRANGKATPAQLAKLTEHFSRPVGQVRKAA